MILPRQLHARVAKAPTSVRTASVSRTPRTGFAGCTLVPVFVPTARSEKRTVPAACRSPQHRGPRVTGEGPYCDHPRSGPSCRDSGFRAPPPHRKLSRVSGALAGRVKAGLLLGRARRPGAARKRTPRGFPSGTRYRRSSTRLVRTPAGSPADSRPVGWHEDGSLRDERLKHGLAGRLYRECGSARRVPEATRLGIEGACLAHEALRGTMRPSASCFAIPVS